MWMPTSLLSPNHPLTPFPLTMSLMKSCASEKVHSTCSPPLWSVHERLSENVDHTLSPYLCHMPCVALKMTTENAGLFKGLQVRGELLVALAVVFRPARITGCIFFKKKKTPIQWMWMLGGFLKKNTWTSLCVACCYLQRHLTWLAIRWWMNTVGAVHFALRGPGFVSCSTGLVATRPAECWHPFWNEVWLKWLLGCFLINKG